MKLKKMLASVLAAAMCFAMAGCGGTDSSDSSSSSSSTSSSTSSESKPESTSTSSESSSTTVESAPESTPEEPDIIKVAALKGPTAMGMTKLMNDNDESADKKYGFEILASPDELTPKIAQGAVDIACVPANLGSVLYSKTEGGVRALAVNTLGVLYICENGDTVTSAADLKGKTIFSSGKGATPEYALNFILKSNGIDPENDVTIEWKSEHAECLASLLATENSVAMLPQPFVTTAQTKNEGVRVALDLNDEWDKLGVDSSLLTGIVIVRSEFADKYPSAVNEFLSEYSYSVDYVNNNIPEGAALIEKYDIVPAAVAEKALPSCHIVCITGSEMKTMLGGYLQVLFDNAPQSVGGAVPADDFYYAYEFPG
ncbi:MAG: PhnD/SsuA/transferrin family substrate-binding protein [Lachnospiraceae bacterium]|nr:PhnD/SsuA/transferrin family substrate-binding protein [Ruminococcus sp.]MCM1275345.1 PhnD/SsuA/transferrin family substrate-binding protein [Lachnospiraceae bacterium]